MSDRIHLSASNKHGYQVEYITRHPHGGDSATRINGQKNVEAAVPVVLGHVAGVKPGLDRRDLAPTGRVHLVTPKICQKTQTQTSDASATRCESRTGPDGRHGESACAGRCASRPPAGEGPPNLRIILSGNRPDGLPFALDAPPVISPSRASMRSKVALVATLSGWVQVDDGQISG